MTQTSPKISTLYKLFLHKLKCFRDTFTQHGYSQSEFQLYFLTQVLSYPIDNQVNNTQCLAQQLKSINSVQKIQQVLAIIDGQLEAIRIMKQTKEKVDQERKSKQSVNNKNNLIANKRKNSKQNKQLKKDRKMKGQKHKKSRKHSQSDDNSDTITFLKDRTSDLVNIFLRENTTANPFIAFKKLSQKDQQLQDKSENEQNQNDFQYERREAREKEHIFQKLLQIQLLSKLLCTDSHSDLLRNQYNPFLMRC